jgi:DNA-binding FadR family transcriptional regulator
MGPIVRTKLAQSVADRLVSDIRARNLPPGTRMPSERDLMEQLGVGRSTIREATNGLAMLGVLEIRHGQGAFVLDPSARAALPPAIAAALGRGVTRDLFEARELVEVHTARLAAELRTDADLREIAQALRIMSKRSRPAHRRWARRCAFTSGSRRRRIARCWQAS